MNLSAGGQEMAVNVACFIVARHPHVGAHDAVGAATKLVEAVGEHLPLGLARVVALYDATRASHEAAAGASAAVEEAHRIAIAKASEGE